MIEKNHTVQDLFSYFSAMNTLDDEEIDYQWIPFQARTKTNLVVINKEMEVGNRNTEIVNSNIKKISDAEFAEYPLPVIVSNNIHSHWTEPERNKYRNHRSSSLVLHPLKSSKSSLSFSSLNPFTSTAIFDPCKEAAKNFKKGISRRNDKKEIPVTETKVNQQKFRISRKLSFSRYLNRQKPFSVLA